MSEPVFLRDAAAFRAWLEAHHADRTELVVGFWKAGTRRPSMTWPESVDVALCFGWIDGLRRRLDDEAYTIRFTPRRPGSIWSAVNVTRVAELSDAGLMTEAGLAAFAARREDRTAVYSHESPAQELTVEEAAALAAEPGAREFLAAQAPSYQRAVVHWLHGAKREETRARRLAQLVDDCAAGRQVAHLRRR